MITIVEVGPRDGLQNEKATIPTDVKVAYIDALSEAGLREIEASAFVSPKWIPQLADAAEVFARIRRKPGVVYSALVPNEQGLERAMAAKVDKIAVFTAASESFNRKNINATIEESIRRFDPVIAKAKAAKLPIRGYVSTAWWCPYEGRVAPEKTADVVKRLVDAGCDDVSLGDTIGKAEPAEVRDVVERLLKIVPAARLAMHFHDTYHRAVENAVEAKRLGIAVFDSSAGGIGGCPYAPGASGNVATEALVTALGVEGVDLGRLAAARAVILGGLKR